MIIFNSDDYCISMDYFYNISAHNLFMLYNKAVFYIFLV